MINHYNSFMISSQNPNTIPEKKHPWASQKKPSSLGKLYKTPIFFGGGLKHLHLSMGFGGPLGMVETLKTNIYPSIVWDPQTFPPPRPTHPARGRGCTIWIFVEKNPPSFQQKLNTTTTKNTGWDLVAKNGLSLKSPTGCCWSMN